MEIQKLFNSNITKSFSGRNKEDINVTELVNYFKHNYSLIDIIKAYNKNPKLTNIAPGTYAMDDYRFFIGAKDGMQEITKIFKTLKKAKVSSAPTFVDETQSAGGQYSLLVLKIPKLKKTNNNFIKNKDSVSFEDRAKFVEELIRLNTETKLYNAAILTNPQSIQITESNQIFIDNWSDLKSFRSEKDKEKWFNKLRTLLGLENH